MERELITTVLERSITRLSDKLAYRDGATLSPKGRVTHRRLIREYKAALKWHNSREAT